MTSPAPGGGERPDEDAVVGIRKPWEEDDGEEDYRDGDDGELAPTPLFPASAAPGRPFVPPQGRGRTCGAAATVRFAGGRVVLRPAPGESVRLGRDPDWAPRTGTAFADELSVSRRHAEIEARSDGSLWLTEYYEGTTHGTSVNGVYLLPGQPRRLADGDRLRLGPRTEATVSLPGAGS